jgi:hypothetical protein
LAGAVERQILLVLVLILLRALEAQEEVELLLWLKVVAQELLVKVITAVHQLIRVVVVVRAAAAVLVL